MEDVLNKQASQLSRILYDQVIRGMAERFVEMNYNEIVASIQPKVLAVEIQRQASLILAERMVSNLKF
jgi:hypothetical protein